MAYGFLFVAFGCLLEVEVFEDFVFFLGGGFGFDFYGGIFLSRGEGVADSGAVGVGEYCVGVRCRGIRFQVPLILAGVAVVVEGGGDLGGVGLLGEHDGYVDGMGFYLLDG